jgi:hypothetical protein
MTGTRVYGPFILAIRKLIQEKNPEGLHFTGAYVEQNLMYDAFYQRYLKKFYTKISYGEYLRNDFLVKLRKRNGQEWKAVEQEMRQEESEHPQRYQGWKETKDKKRKRYLALTKAVGKIVSFYGEPVYLMKVTPEDATIMAIYQTTVYEKPYIEHSSLTAFTPQEANVVKDKIYVLKRFLELKNKIKNIQIWTEVKPEEAFPQGWDHI